VKNPSDFSCGLVLLAAGASRRMGRPKQLLPIGGRAMIRHVVESLGEAPIAPFVVVLGAGAEDILPTLAGLPIVVVTNPRWEEGMGSSLRAGVASVLNLSPQLQGLIVALADQPGLPAPHLEKLIARYRQGGCSLVATKAGSTRVPPVLFGASWFSHLQTLAGDKGARDLLRQERPDFASVPLATITDLDTPEDYDRFLAAQP